MEYEYGPIPFTKTRILIVEGKDEVDFFTKLLVSWLMFLYTITCTLLMNQNQSNFIIIFYEN